MFIYELIRSKTAIAAAGSTALHIVVVAGLIAGRVGPRPESPVCQTTPSKAAPPPCPSTWAQDDARLPHRVDAARMCGDVLPPLHGVPVTTKVNSDQAGLPTDNSFVALKDFIAREDNPVVANLKRAGAIIVGIFGMNTAGLPLTETAGGFAIAIFLGLAATGLFYWALRRAGLDARF